MAAGSGKVALVSNTTLLACGSSANRCTTNPTFNQFIVDFVGYGSTASDYEGAGPAGTLTSATAALRAGAGCIDTDNNNADFAVVAPTPRNSSSPPNTCGGATATATTVPPTNTVGGPTSTNTPLPPTSTNTATVTPTAPPARIREIQAISHISPRNGQTVGSVPGIVTALRSNGFYMQDPNPDSDESTSEAIFVFTSSVPTVAVGDAVTVSGTVSEFRPGGSGSTNLTTTQIGSPVITVVSTGNTLPTPVVISVGGRVPPTVVIEDDATGSVETSGVFDPAQDGIDFYESLEAMRVQVNNPVAVGPTSDFGEIPVLADDGAGAGVRTTRGGIIISPPTTPFDYTTADFNPERIILDDAIVGGANMPDVNVGDHFGGPAIGVMDYSFGNFKLNVTSALTRVNSWLTREVSATPGANQLVVGNFNVENLDPGDPQSKFDDLAALIVNNLRSPDILSIEEIQDNNGPINDAVVDADVTFNRLIAAIQAQPGGPTYQYR
ncbi:MAG: hypothetical protein ABIO92_06805, partial [Chloroflexia bacterium]